jgi:uncharacterized membrane protein
MMFATMDTSAWIAIVAIMVPTLIGFISQWIRFSIATALIKQDIELLKTRASLSEFKDDKLSEAINQLVRKIDRLITIEEIRSNQEEEHRNHSGENNR